MAAAASSSSSSSSSMFLYHVVGDLTVGKPELVEFAETESVEAAIRAIGESAEGNIHVWRKRLQKSGFENAEMRQQRFVGILNSLDIVAFLATDWCLEDPHKAMNTPVSEVVIPNNSLLKVVDPAARLIDALEMMKQGVSRLLVPKSVVWKGMSKRFSILYNGKWLKNQDSSSSSSLDLANLNRPSSSTAIIRDKFCCLSREDVIRFLIGRLGALAPIPLSSIASLEAIDPNYCSIEASLPAMEVVRNKIPHDPSAVAVVEHEGQNNNNNKKKIIGEISTCKLWKCDYLAAAWALANFSAGQFVMGGVEDNVNNSRLLHPDLTVNHHPPSVGTEIGSTRARKFSSRNIGFFSDPAFGNKNINNNNNNSSSRSMYRGRSAPLTCKVTSSLAAVMAQMLSHRATHVWVTEAENDDILVGIVGYKDILAAVTRQPPPAAAPVFETTPS